MSELILEVPEEKKAPMVQDMLATLWVTTVIGLVKEVGPDKALEVVGPMMESAGRSKAELMFQQIPKPENNALGLAAWTNTWEVLLGIEGKIDEASPERVVKTNTKCSLAASKCPVLCDLIGCSLKGSGSVISPDFKFYTTHKMTQGDEVCRWVIER